MPTEISERDLIFSFEDAISVVRFDDDVTHGMNHLQHGLKRVDFIVEMAEETILIEVTDPDCKQIPKKHLAERLAAFRRQRHSGTLYSEEFAPKLRDTLVYLCLAHRAPTNCIRYVAFIGFEELDSALLLRDQERLEEHCYLPGPGRKAWPSTFGVLVVNIAAWNRKLKPHSVRRET